MTFKVYDSNEVTVVFGPVVIDNGLGENEFVSIEPAPDKFTMVVGADGSVTRSKSNNHTAVVKITLMQSSDINFRLSTIHNLDLVAPNGAGVLPLLVRDRQGTTLHSGAEAWIVQAPTNTFDKVATPREWVLHVAKLSGVTGGN